MKIRLDSRPPKLSHAMLPALRAERKLLAARLAQVDRYLGVINGELRPMLDYEQEHRRARPLEIRSPGFLVEPIRLPDEGYQVKLDFNKILELAGKDGFDPVFRQCSKCKKFQIYNESAEKDTWKPADRFSLAVDLLMNGFLDLVQKTNSQFPSVSHGMCPPCMAEWAKENGFSR